MVFETHGVVLGQTRGNASVGLVQFLRQSGTAQTGHIWHLDESCAEHRAEFDVLVRERRDRVAAKRFFRRVLR